MSHVATVDLHITSLPALREACELMGLEFVEGSKSYKWYGRHAGDYPLPTGFSKDELGKCLHEIRVKDNSGAYSVGVCERRDGKPGYTLLWDFWAGGNGLQQAIGKDAVAIKNAYAAITAKRELARKGYRIASIERKGHAFAIVGRK